METEQKVKMLEDRGFDWLKIAAILNISYEEVRGISEDFTEKGEQADLDTTKVLGGARKHKQIADEVAEMLE